MARSGAGRYETHVSEAFAFGGAPNGGYLLATLLRAAVAETAHAHPLLASVEFARVARTGPAQVAVEVLRTGRSLSSARATLSQDGDPVAEALVTVATLAPGEPLRWSAPAPQIAPLDDCPLAQSAQEGLARQLELRFDPAADGWRAGRPSGRPEARAWFRLRHPTEPDPYVLALAADALPPVTVNVGLRGWAPTVRLTWQLRALPAPGWLAVHAHGRAVSERWFDEDVEIWDAEGRLVAQSRQLALVPRRHTT